MSEVPFERLLGRRVVDERGRKVGRLEEAVAVRRGGEWVVVEFHAGTAALLERLAASVFGFLGGRGVRIPAERLDLSDPEHPRLVGDPAELATYRKRKPGR